MNANPMELRGRIKQSGWQRHDFNAELSFAIPESALAEGDSTPKFLTSMIFYLHNHYISIA